MSNIEHYWRVEELTDAVLHKTDPGARWLPIGGAALAVLSGALGWFGYDRLAGVAGALGGLSIAIGIVFAVTASKERDRRLWLRCRRQNSAGGHGVYRRHR